MAFWPAVIADLGVMEADTGKVRATGSYWFAQVKNGVGVPEIVDHILHARQHALGIEHHHHAH